VTPRELCDHAEELAAKATKGPWVFTDEYQDASKALESVRAMVICPLHDRFTEETDLEVSPEDRAFITASRTLVPQLAAALREACELLYPLAWRPSTEPSDTIRVFLISDVEVPDEPT